MFSMTEICYAVRMVLQDEDRYRQYRDKPLPAGCCYPASEAIYHLNKLVGPHHVLQSYRIVHEHIPHWFLRDFSEGVLDAMQGVIIDVTVEQFETTPYYTDAKRLSFLTPYPSNRAERILIRATEFLESHKNQPDIRLTHKKK